MQRLLSSIDPLIRLLLLAILLASLFPADGAARPIAQSIADGGIFLLFFLNGLRLARADVIAGMSNLKLLVPLVLWCFGAMAMAGLGLSMLGEALLPQLVALGFIYLGVMPSTVQSAIAYSSLAGGNVAASVVAAALLSLLGVFVAAPLLALLSGGGVVDLGTAGLVKIGLILLLPFALGQIAQPWLTRFLAHSPGLIRWLDRLAIALAVYVAFSGAVEQGLWQRIGPADWAALLLLETVMLGFAFGGAWLFARALRLPRTDRISFLFAGAHKSIAMGAPLALVLFRPEDAGLILLPLLLYHLLQLALSVPLASRFASGPE